MNKLLFTITFGYLACAMRVNSTPAMQKRNIGGDTDVPKCIENFDIHKDKIIRTTDSRAMGAKYLNEMDLDSREECLRLCCETENCDVFVYEEKNAGSCYLFQCGPPEDFKCKFTHHVNYTSAINRHLLDLESQIKLTKHEQDLTKLRKPEVINTGSVETTTRPSSTTSKSTTIISKILNAHTETPAKPANKKCSPFQFECRSTRECIAIYNACDGIPQCADESDEGPELQCPDATATSGRIQQAPLLQPQELQPRLQLGPQSQIQSPNPDLYRLRLPAKQPVDNLNPGRDATRQQPDFLRPVSDPQNPLHGPQYDPQQLSQYQYLVPQGQQSNWEHMPQQEMSNNQHGGQYQSKNSHIFNHKETGLQVPDVAEPSQMQYVDGQRLRNYYGADVYGQQIPQLPPILENNWPNGNNHPDFRQNIMYPNQDVNSGRETWNPHQQGPAKTETNKMIYNQPATKDLPQIIETKEIGKHEQEKVANDLKNSKQHFADQNIALTSSISKPTHSNTGNNYEHDHNQPGKYITEYKITSETLTAIEDGIAETPGGAVLSLSLGLVLTALMGILIGCRLRVVRRRLRRGGKSFAHDADYLVNGMYL
ncbi:uncharacterized protein [Atheta coriaria]|uniref:uncharacterized protein isoform X2 n=1 Tax=Dalotia coriaria TaxID=877792 RepID=UPI0031F3C4BF